MASVIEFPAPWKVEVVQALEHCLSLARKGELAALSISYTDAEMVMYDCIEARNHYCAVTLLGQVQMLRRDLIDLTIKLRDGYTEEK